jgi:hypothetical protein
MARAFGVTPTAWDDLERASDAVIVVVAGPGIATAALSLRLGSTTRRTHLQRPRSWGQFALVGSGSRCSGRRRPLWWTLGSLDRPH